MSSLVLLPHQSHPDRSLYVIYPNFPPNSLSSLQNLDLALVSQVERKFPHRGHQISPFCYAKTLDFGLGKRTGDFRGTGGLGVISFLEEREELVFEKASVW